MTTCSPSRSNICDRRLLRIEAKAALALLIGGHAVICDDYPWCAGIWGRFQDSRRRFAPISTQAYGGFCHKRSRTRSRVLKLNLLKLFLASIVFASTPVFAAPEWVDSRCLYHANRVLPALDYREREAYRANCVANWTAGYPPPPRRSKRAMRTKRNRH